MKNDSRQIPVGYLIYHAQRAIHQAINQAFYEADIPMTIEQWPVMMEIFNSNGTSQQLIANKTKKDKTTLTRLIATLAKNGLVECRHDQSDKRKKLIFHTEKAIKIKTQSEKILNTINQRIMTGVDNRNETIFRKVLKTIFLNLDWNFEFMNIDCKN